MAKLLRMSRYVKGNAALAPPNKELGFANTGRMDENHLLPTHMPELFLNVSGQRWTLRFSAEARLLLVIGVVCGLLIYEGGKRSAVATPKLNEPLQTRAEPQAEQLTPLLSKPSPIVPAGTARSARLLMPKETPGAVPHSPSQAVHDSSTTYEATHKKLFGSCAGQLELSGSSLVFHCPNQADLVLPIAAIANAHKDGVLLKSGEKYHFLIANHTPGQAQAIFISWLNKAQQFPQAIGVASF